MTDTRVGTIEIIAEPPPLMMFARWMKISIAIDGQLARMPWGAHAFEVAVGDHVVAVGVGSGFSSKAVLSVSVTANELLRLRYVPRLFKNLRGKLQIERLPVARALKL